MFLACEIPCSLSQGTYDNFIIFVCSFSWMLTVFQGFDKFRRLFIYMLTPVVLKYVRGRMHAAHVVGLIDKDGHRLDDFDVSRLAYALSQQLLEDVGTRFLGSPESADRIPSRSDVAIRYTLWVFCCTLVTAVELFFQWSAAWGILNLYVMLPLVCLVKKFFGDYADTMEAVEILIGGGKAAILRAWEIYKL